MKRIEALSIAGALCAGSVAGFAGARWGWAPDARKDGAVGERAVLAAALRTQPVAAEVSPTRSEGDVLEGILQDKLPSRRRVALDRFCDGLDAAGARRAVEAMPAGEEADVWEVRGQLISRWAELEPAAAAAFALEKMSNHLGSVLSVWVARDRDAAKSFVAGIRDKKLLDGILYSFTNVLAERDFEDALRFADAVPAAARRDVIWGAFHTVARKNVPAALARVMALPEGEARENAIAVTTNVWLSQNPQAAMAWVMQRPDTPVMFGQTLFESAIRSWTGEDPATVGRFVLSLPAGKHREAGIAMVAQMWSYDQTGAALRWVQSLPDGKTKTEALSRVMSRWSYEDAPAAAAFLARQTAGANKGEMLATVGERWAKVDPTAAMAWAAAQRNEALEKSVATEAFGNLAADDPAAAVAGLASLRGVETRAAAITAIAKSWADRDPHEAARWVLELPVADASSEALRQVISTGTAHDPVAMASWLETIKTHPQRDVAVEAFASAAQYHDPTAAAEWANTLSDAKKRKPLVQKIVRAFANFDAPAARDWVLGQTFEPAERTALLGQIENAERRK